jgi:cytochrome c
MHCTLLPRFSRSFLLVTLALLFTALPVQAQTVDEDAAVALAKKGHCFKCHAVEKRKKAPSYREVAKKYSTKPDAEQSLFLHITGKPVLKLEEGDEPHAAPPTDDLGQLSNLIKWILSRNTAT